MNRNTLLATVSALALLSASGVKAADLAVKAPPVFVAPVPVYSWTGCYVGAHVGWGWGQNSYSQSAVRGGSFSGGGTRRTIGGKTNSNGALFGGQVGCNYQFASNWVIGVQGDIAGTDINGKSRDTFGLAFAGPGDYVGQIGIKTDWLASVTGRIGYAFYNNQGLVYVKGGGAWIENQWNLNSAFLFYPNDLVTETRSGWTVGVGAEWMFSQNWTGFVEFNYYNFGNGGLLSTSPFDGAPAFYSGKQDIETVKIGVNYKFGWGGAPVVAKY